jgi:flagellar hook-basal body complex protein FliE
MAGAITGIGNIQPPDIIRPGDGSAGSVAGAAGGDFRSVLAGAIDRVEKVQANASQAVDRYLSGEGEELHSAAMAAQRAELSLDLFLQVRNKVVSAYQEVMRMQL